MRDTSAACSADAAGARERALTRAHGFLREPHFGPRLDLELGERQIFA